MIKDKLNKLLERNLDASINRGVMDMIENYGDDQLDFLMSTVGMKINDNIIVMHHNGVGFKCIDVNERITGKSPLCQNVERFLNRV